MSFQSSHMKRFLFILGLAFSTLFAVPNVNGLICVFFQNDELVYDVVDDKTRKPLYSSRDVGKAIFNAEKWKQTTNLHFQNEHVEKEYIINSLYIDSEGRVDFDKSMQSTRIKTECIFPYIVLGELEVPVGSKSLTLPRIKKKKLNG